MELVLSKKVVKACTFVALFLLLSGCSPKLNWRTVQSPEQHYSVLFPGKPDKLERKIPYQDQELLQTLEAVKIEDDIYSVSTIKLTASQSTLAPKLIGYLQNNLLERAKASGDAVATQDTFYQDSKHQHLPIKDYFISFSANGKVQQTMRVRWITRSTDSGNIWVYQVSVLHTSANSDDAKTLLSKEEYANFFNEFYPE